MDRKMKVAMLMLAVIVLCLFAAQVMAAEQPEGKEVDVTWKQVPKVVRATMLKEAKGEKILGVEKATDEKGVVTYSADVKIGGKLHDIIVAANGKLIKVQMDAPEAAAPKAAAKESDEAGEANEPANEKEVKFADLPAAVQKTIKKFAGSGKINGVESGVQNGKTVYSADVVKNGKTIDVVVAADGKLIKTEIDAPAKAGKPAPEADEKGEAGEKGE